MAVLVAPMGASPDPCAKPPAEVVRVLEPGWRMLALQDLHPDDRQIWMAVRPQACPGFALARMSSDAAPSIAVAQVRAGPKGLTEKVILVSSRQSVQVLQSGDVGRAPLVVWRAPPGQTRSWDGAASVFVRWDSVVVEKIEASARQFYLDRGRLKSLVTSD